MPEVSVVIPAYNAARTIDAALDSVFAQTYRDFEVVVVDDGSTDDTAAMVAERAHVTLLTQPNCGPAAARNAAIERATGRLVAFLDADDVWLPEKLEHQVAYFSAYPTTGLVHSTVIVSHSVHVRPPSVGGANPLAWDPPSNRFAEIFHGDRDVNTLTAMVRREVLDEVGRFDERRELHVEDWDLWLRIAARYPIGFLPSPYAIHRPGGSMSSVNEKTFSGQLLVIAKTAPLCGAACSRHPEQPDTCVAARRHLLYRDMGYRRFWRGDAEGARAAFERALAIDPDDVRARWYYRAASAGRGWIAPLRILRTALRRDGHRSSQAAISAPNLVHDTVYRRARRSLVGAVHRIDDRLAHMHHDRVRVLFEAASPLSLAVFRPVFERLQPDARLEFTFTSCDQAWDMRQMFADVGLADRVVEPARASRMKFDAYINTDFWSHTWVSRRVRRMHLFHGVAGKYDLDAPTALAPEVASFDRLLFPNRDRLRRYAEAGLVDPAGPQAVLVGYPKVDCLVDGSLDRRRIASSLRLDPRRPTVLYAPTWSPASSLNTHGEEIVKALSVLGVNVIVKLHDRSCDATARGSGGVNWRDRLAQLNSTREIHLAELADASQYMCVADALVTDHSSVGFEFMLLDRPVIVIDCPVLLEHARVNREKAALLRSAAMVVADPAALGSVVLSSLSRPGTHGELRRAIAAKLFYRAGTATSRAVAAFYEMVELPLPVTEPAVGSRMQAPALPVPMKSA